VTDTRFFVTEPQTASGEPDKHKVVTYCTAIQRHRVETLPEGDVELYSEPSGRSALFYFYASGPRTGAAGAVKIAVLPSKSFARSAAAAAFLVALLLWTFAIHMTQVMSNSNPAVAVLLVVPAILAYVLVRPQQHVLAVHFLQSLRVALILVASLPLLGAIAAIYNGLKVTSGLVTAFWVLAIMGSVLALPLLVAALWPVGRFRQPLSEALRRRERAEEARLQRLRADGASA
jgi:hypothetical protein